LTPMRVSARYKASKFNPEDPEIIQWKITRRHWFSKLTLMNAVSCIALNFASMPANKTMTQRSGSGQNCIARYFRTVVFWKWVSWNYF
jgi:hypothetical protein